MADKPTKASKKAPKLVKTTKKPATKERGYFKGAWYELRQVRWPDRKATWGLTLAVILFSLFFAGLILGLDYIFEALFRKVII